MVLSIELPKETEELLRERAAKQGVSVEALAHRILVDVLSGANDDEFDDIMKRVIERNAELYRRLA